MNISKLMAMKSILMADHCYYFSVWSSFSSSRTLLQVANDDVLSLKPDSRRYFRRDYLCEVRVKLILLKCPC